MDDRTLKLRQLNRLGGACAIAVGASYAVVTPAFLLDRTRGILDPRKLWPGLARSSRPRVTQYWAYALGATAAFGALPAISELVRDKNEGLVRWATGLAYLSFGVTATETFRLVTATPAWAEKYLTGDATVRAAIETTDLLLRLDPATFLRFAALSPFFLVVNLLARQHGLLPRELTTLGIALGLLTAATTLGIVLQIGPLVLVSAVLGGAVAAPAWFVWTGIELRRLADPAGTLDG
jgi:hypothetical protein